MMSSTASTTTDGVVVAAGAPPRAAQQQQQQQQQQQYAHHPNPAVMMMLSSSSPIPAETLAMFNTEMNATVRRFPGWISLFVFSLVCLISELSSAEKGDHVRNGLQRWVLTVFFLSVFFTAISVFGYMLMRGIYVGQSIEVALLSLVSFIWILTLPIIMNPSNNVIETDGGIIIDANLYFFTWLSFFTVLYLIHDMIREKTGINLIYKNPNTSAQMIRWYGLTLSSLIVTITTSRIFKVSKCNSNRRNNGYFDNQDAAQDEVNDEFNVERSYCTGCAVAIAIGVVCVAFAGNMCLWLNIEQSALYPIDDVDDDDPENATGGGGGRQQQQNQQHNGQQQQPPEQNSRRRDWVILVIEASVAAFIFGLWCVGISYITFGSETTAPGAAISNLFFATWISFLLSLFILAHALQEIWQDLNNNNNNNIAAAMSPAQQQQQQQNNVVIQGEHELGLRENNTTAHPQISSYPSGPTAAAE